MSPIERSPGAPAPGASEARVLILSQRTSQKHVANASFFETEDAIAALDRADIVSLPRIHGDRLFDLSRKAWKGVRRVSGRESLADRVPAPRQATVERDYDILFLPCATLFDLYLLQTVRGWRERCRHVVAWVMEAWPSELEGRAELLEPLEGVDLFVSGNAVVTPFLEEISGVRSRYLPTGVDMDAFEPRRDSARGIGVINIGRRSAVTHQALLAWAEREDAVYWYDTIENPHARDHLEHRRFLGHVMRHTDVCIANYAKFDWSQEQIGDYRDIPHRVFEGLAAGCVNVGAPCDENALLDCFGRTDVVVPAPVDAPDIGDLLSDLRRRPDEVAEIRRRNVHTALGHVDHAHRWRSVLDALGLEGTDALRRREEQLAERAEAWA